MIRYLFLFAALSGLCSVVFGAFGAHALNGLLEPRMLAAFKTGVQYQMSHSLILLITLLIRVLWQDNRVLELACYSFVVGILLFPGSLYLLALTGLGWLGPVTPLGGVMFIIGWLLLAIGTWRVEK